MVQETGGDELPPVVVCSLNECGRSPFVQKRQLFGLWRLWGRLRHCAELHGGEPYPHQPGGFWRGQRQGPEAHHGLAMRLER